MQQFTIPLKIHGVERPTTQSSHRAVGAGGRYGHLLFWGQKLTYYGSRLVSVEIHYSS